MFCAEGDLIAQKYDLYKSVMHKKLTMLFFTFDPSQVMPAQIAEPRRSLAPERQPAWCPVT